MQKSIFLSAVILFFTFNYLPAQDWLDKATKLATSSAGKKGSELKVALDSIDFQFAISINDNAGFFDIEQKGETGSKLLYGLKSTEDKTFVEKARDSLEQGIGMYELRRYKFAEIQFLEVKNLLEINNLQNEIVYLRTMSNLGLIYLVQGKTTEAEQYIASTISESENRLGKNSAAYIANLNNYAKLHQSLGKYNEAEKEFNEAQLLANDFFGGGMQQAIILNNKAMLAQVVGRYDEAERLMKEAIIASETAPKKALKGNKSFDNRKFQANMATMYQLMGKYTEAEKNFQSIKKIFDNRGQTSNAEYAALLNQMGILYIQMGKTEKVEELLTKSASIYKKRFTEQNIYFAKVLNDLGNFYRLTERYADAEKQLTKSFAIREVLLNNTHPDFVRTQEDLAILYWKTGKLEKAYTLYQDVMNKTLDFIDHYFPPMSEAEKTKYWDVTAPRFQRFYNFALDNYAQLPAVAQDLYNYNIATKALLLNATNKIKDNILRSNNTQLIKDYFAWLDLKEQLSQIYAYSKKKQKDQNINLPELERQANDMEKSLSARSGEFSSGYVSKRIDFKQIVNTLTEAEAVVDILRVRGFNQDFTQDVRYVALVLKKGMQSPTVVVIKNGQELETRYSKYYRNTIQQRGDDQFSYDQFWAAIEPTVTSKKIVYVSPDGVYNQINLNTLKKKDGQFVISQCDLVILGNSKDLVSLKTKKAAVPKKNAFLLGFPSYGTTEVAALPGTKIEIDGVSKILTNAGYKVNKLTEKEANEKNIKVIKGSEVVHIATHGYFLKDAEASTNGSVFGVNAENASNNPLLRSGLILAGANKSISDTEADISDNDNGVLTAYEAMNLNLEGTNLVILSACETGLGEVKSGEGVYGLQRAFLVAGADALIMSLWKVDDAATQQLMTNFYTNWIKLRDKQKAFKQAQLQLMAKYKEPYFWGAFVMIGM
jgi:CHAT domain-containing protein